ncbi:uncharacterized protein [Mytilus edulis]|uniref:uncharacterized protein n=1 Tax=Mytilus edulis TaxID=6550 RepID=UPI0039EE5822
MATVKTFDVTAVTGLPPKPNHMIPKFHNRSNLFPSTFTNKLYEEKQITTSQRQAWSADPRKRSQIESICVDTKNNLDVSKTTVKQEKSAPRRRPFSAKARLESLSSKPPRTKHARDNVSVEPVHGSSRNTCMELVPVGGKEVPVVDIGDNAPYPTYHYLLNSKEKYVSDDTKPFLPGLADNRVPPLTLNHASEAPVLITAGPSIKPMVHGLNSHQVIFGTDNDGQPQDIKYDLRKPSVLIKQERPLPSTLEPLRSWLTEDKSIPGINDCLIFLPAMDNYKDLPEVPPPHSVQDDLPFTSKLPPQQAVTKKYHHPAFDKKHVEDWVCNHSRPGSSQRTDHQSYQTTYRNAGDIREEITELENLMQGLGNIDSDCGMVKFQGEIDRFRQMYRETMNMVPERLLHSPKDPDTFGVKEFLKQHVDIMNEIHRKHTLCLEELRIIEVEAGIDSSRKYFKHRTVPPDT